LSKSAFLFSRYSLRRVRKAELRVPQLIVFVEAMLGVASLRASFFLKNVRLRTWRVRKAWVDALTK
jgi:hypothetical protein